MVRTTEDVIGMKRRDLAAVHASELNAALFPNPERGDDALSEGEKLAIQEAVAALVHLHRQELAAWIAANA
jgi:hypothetical protein